MVMLPTTTLGTSTRPGWSRVSNARETRLPPSAAYPVKLVSCPSTMLMPTAATKPVITEPETKRRNVPRRSTPATIITTPVTMLSVNSVRAGSARASRSTSATMIDIAPVAWTAMYVELVNSVPPTIPNR